MNKYIYNLIIGIIFLNLILITSCEHHKTHIEVEETDRVVKVEVTKPQINDYTQPYALSGIIKAHQKATLASKVTSQILDITVEEGNEVKSGQILVKLDDRETKLRMIKTEAEDYRLRSLQNELNEKLDELKNKIQMLFHDQEKYISQAELAQSTFDRFSKLKDREVLTMQEFDEAKASLESANATVAKSQAEYNLLLSQKKQLDSQNQQLTAQIESNKAEMASAMVSDSYYQLSAPFNGIVVNKYVDTGDLAVTGKPLMTVENPKTLYLEINVEESNAFAFKPGSGVDVYIDAYPKVIIPAIVREVIPSADPETHTFKVKIDLPAHKAIHSGMYARVILPMGGKSVFVPRTAIVIRGQITGVFLIDDKNIARFRIIKTGQEIQGFVEILSGLNEKDKVVISNLENLTDGTKVIVLGES